MKKINLRNFLIAINIVFILLIMIDFLDHGRIDEDLVPLFKYNIISLTVIYIIDKVIEYKNKE